MTTRIYHVILTEKKQPIESEAFLIIRGVKKYTEDFENNTYHLEIDGKEPIIFNQDDCEDFTGPFDDTEEQYQASVKSRTEWEVRSLQDLSGYEYD